jgi:DNA-binding NtrC family response regulator
MKARDRDHRLDIVARIVRALNSSVAGTQEPLHAILKAVLAETGADRGFLMLYAEGTLAFSVGMSREGRLLGRDDFLYSTSIVGAALEQGRCLLVGDLRGSLPLSEATSVQQLGIRSAACAPLLAPPRRRGAAADPIAAPSVRGVAGILYVDSREEHAYAPEDVPFFESLADAAMLAVRAVRTESELRESRATAVRTKELDARGRTALRESSAADGAEPLRYPFDELVTRDPGMRKVLKLVEQLVPSQANVLIRGESGTGKELVARALHRYGLRGVAPFVAVDCGAIPDELLSSELFGHEENAFTNAGPAKPGLVESAHRGVLFLDEVGEASPTLQAALLRVLQEGEVRRLGGSEARRVDVRVVSATNRDLKAMVERGDFRHDLFFRLAVVEVRLPPLRARRDDTVLLVQRALAGRAPIDPDALARLEEHGWPGNVRELRNVIEHLVVVHRGSPITLAAVEDALREAPRILASNGAPAATVTPGAFEGTFEEIERRVLVERLKLFRGNQLRTAESLGIDRRTLFRRMKRFGLSRN